ncbi:MAG TPA: TetR/AcrR family transcriptional regulator [Anaerolineae bacterium]|nr:TetR/AcrR family transcriptional regulator [Anaerolineae bacterium]
MGARTEETKIRLQQALLDLLEREPYEAISMSAIAREAGRVRSTLYRHYNDKDELLLDCLSYTIESLKDEVVYPTQLPLAGPSLLAQANLKLFYGHVEAQRPLYHALFKSPASPHIRYRFRRVVAGILLQFTEQTGSLKILPAPADMVCNLIAEMVVGAAVWYLEAGDKYEPALLAEIVVRLGEAGLFGLNGQVAQETDLSFRPFGR